jgi:uncharacterized protein YdhG (YjbR/CyaY superfamily)
VDAYIATLPEDRRTTMTQLRETIRAAAPAATEVMAYNMPAFRLGGRFLVSYDAYKGHTSLFPASQVVRDTLGAELFPYLSGRGTIRFPAGQPIPLNLVTWLVGVRLTELAAQTA